MQKSLEKTKRILGISLLLCGCAAASDNTPPWSSANRYSVEMINDCNLTTHSIGISGCAFYSDNVYGNVTFPALFSGDLYLTSQFCKNVSTIANKINDNVLQLVDIYTNPNKFSCSFEITRTLRYGNQAADGTMRGRFFIRIINKANPYYTKMRFSYGKEQFSGVGWTQVKTSVPEAASDPILTVFPTGTRGVFTASCNDEIRVSQNYATKPFDVALPAEPGCDYELAAVNSDTTKIDVATFIIEVQKRTIDLTVPKVTIKSGKISFEFLDRDASGKKYVVVGVKIDNNNACENSNKCSTYHNKNTYTVKALTMLPRQFWGKYNAATKTWELK